MSRDGELLRIARSEDPQPASGGAGELNYSPEPWSINSPTERRWSMVAAIALHAVVFIILTMTFKGPEIFTPSKPTQITWIELGDAPPTGDPNGDVAPPKPVEEVQPSPKDVPEKVSAEKPEEEEIEKPKLPAKLAEPSSSSQSAAAEPTNTMPVDVYGAGTLALGAKTHGDGGGLDGDLSAAIGQAIANQISACWEAPKVALPNDLSIIMTVAFDRAGVLVGDPIVARLIQEEQKIVTQPDAFELAAMDAVKRCTPIRLPPGLYPYWSKIDVTIFSSVVPETRPGPQTQS